MASGKPGAILVVTPSGATATFSPHSPATTWCSESRLLTGTPPCPHSCPAHRCSVEVFRELSRSTPPPRYLEHFSFMGAPFRVGNCRCSTDEQDVEIQTDQLLALGVPKERIFIDRGFSGTTRRNRAGLDNARAAVTAAGAVTSSASKPRSNACI